MGHYPTTFQKVRFPGHNSLSHTHYFANNTNDSMPPQRNAIRTVSKCTLHGGGKSIRCKRAQEQETKGSLQH